jgi:hypothetical protein
VVAGSISVVLEPELDEWICYAYGFGFVFFLLYIYWRAAGLDAVLVCGCFSFMITRKARTLCMQTGGKACL